jgi:hypothetical protein
MGRWWRGCWFVLWVASARALTVEGTVVDVQGQPVAGVFVWANSGGPPHTSPPAHTTSAADGGFALTLPGEAGAGTLVAGAYLGQRIATYAGRTLRRLQLVLQPGVTVRGTVVNSSGVVCVGAVVRLAGWDRGGPAAAEAQRGWTRAPGEPWQHEERSSAPALVGAWPAAPLPAPSAVSDAWGGFTLGPVPLDATPTVWVDHPACALQRLRCAGDLDACRLSVPRATTLTGQVRRPDGSPLAGLALVVWSDPDQPLRETTTDGEGRYRLERAPWGDLSLGPADWGLAETCAAREVRAAGPATTCDLTGAPGRVLRLTATDGGTGRPVAGVGLAPRAVGKPWHATQLAAVRLPRTDAGGTLTARVPAEARRFAVQSPPGWFVPSASEVDLGPGTEPATRAVVLWRFRRVEGRVTLPDGQPLSAARLEVTVRAGRQTLLRTTTGTVATGEFLLPEAPLDGDLEVTVWHAMGAKLHAATFPAARLPAGRWELVVPPLAPRHLTGRVVDHLGRPLAGCEVRVEIEPERPHSPNRHGGQHAATTNAQGVYVLRDLPPAESYRVIALLRDYYWRAPVVVKADALASPPDVVLETEDGQVAGRVVDGDGQPLKGAVVLVLDGPAEATTKADGAFELTSLRPRQVTLLALHGASARGETTCAVGSRDVVLRVAPAKARSAAALAEWAAGVLRELWDMGDASYPPGLLLAGLARQDPDAALDLLARVTVTNPNGGVGLALGLLAVARTAPRLASGHLDLLEKITSRATRTVTTAALAAEFARGPGEPAAARLFAQIPAGKQSRAVEMHRATAALRLGRPEAPTLAATVVSRLKAEGKPHELTAAAYHWAAHRAQRDLALAALPDDRARCRALLCGVLNLRDDLPAALAQFEAACRLLPDPLEHDEAEDETDTAAWVLAELADRFGPTAPEAVARLYRAAPYAVRCLAGAAGAAAVADHTLGQELLWPAMPLASPAGPGHAWCAAVARHLPDLAKALADFGALLARLDKADGPEPVALITAVWAPNVPRLQFERRLRAVGARDAVPRLHSGSNVRLSVLELPRIAQVARGLAERERRIEALFWVAWRALAPPWCLDLVEIDKASEVPLPLSDWFEGIPTLEGFDPPR